MVRRSAGAILRSRDLDFASLVTTFARRGVDPRLLRRGNACTHTPTAPAIRWTRHLRGLGTASGCASQFIDFTLTHRVAFVQ